MPKADDERWVAIVEGKMEEYYREYSAKCRAAGVRFLVGEHWVDGKGEKNGRMRLGADWRKLAREGIIDGFVVMGIKYDQKDPFGSTARIYRYVMENRGKAEVYFPLPAYDFYSEGISSYAKLSGLSRADTVTRLLKLAKEAGGRGVVLECVDHEIYTKPEREAIAAFMAEK